MVERCISGVRWSLVLLVLLVYYFVSLHGGPARAQDAPAGSPSSKAVATGSADCGELAGLIQQEKNLIAREMGQIKREIAALRDDLSKPGLKEIFAGIGYILGLAGIGLYAHCRKTRVQKPEGTTLQD